MTAGEVRLRVEALAVMALLALGVWARLDGLGWPPLTEQEAVRALSALQATDAPSPFWAQDATPDNPAYSTTTALLFQTLGAGEATARAVSALMGAALLLAPLALRRRLGAARTILIIAGLTLSPVLITLSRTAGGGAAAVMALGGALALMWGAAESRGRRLGVAALLGVALAAGPASLQGLMALLIGWGIYRAWSWRRDDDHAPLFANFPRRGDWWPLPLVALALATGFGFVPDGLAGIFEGLGSWLQGWRGGAGIPALSFAAALGAYEPVLLALGLAGAWRALRHDGQGSRFAISWAVGATVAGLIYPGRAASDVAWLVLPLALLASQALCDFLGGFEMRGDERWAWLGMVVGLLVLMAFAYLQLAAYAMGLGPNVAPLAADYRLAYMVAALGLGTLVVVLFALGWGWRTAWQAVATAGLSVLLLLNVFAAWHLNAGRGAARAREFWRPQATTVNVNLMLDTLRAIGRANYRQAEALPIAVQTHAPAWLAWSVREFKAGEVPAAVPTAVLTRDGEDLGPAAVNYVGQKIALEERWDWQGALPPSLLAWLLRREAPVVTDTWLVLVPSQWAVPQLAAPAASETTP